MMEMRESEGELIKSLKEAGDINFLDEKKMKRKFLLISILSILIAVIIIFVILIFTVFNKEDKDEDHDEDEDNIDPPNELDTIPKEEFEKARNSFKQYNFIDTEDSSKVLPYNIFIPENYNDTQNIKYPLIVFIGDASTVGKEITYPINETVGGPIWATDTVQKKHKCFVLVPEYKDVIIDDRGGYTKSEYINVTIRLISKLLNEYKIDPNRIYGTGQSMGAMTTLYILANYPNVYAAGLIVDGQWIKEELLGLVNATFTYFAARGDEKAFNGQNEIKEYLDSENISYGNLNEVNAQEEVEILNNLTLNMYKSNFSHNFITYANGTVFPPNTKGNNEHMSSFKYGYRIETVRDWIFEQNKVKCEDELYYSQDGKCSITSFCAISRNDHSCKECLYGYYFSTDRTCTNDINCKKGDKQTGFCSWCEDDYYLDLQEKKCKSNLDKEEFRFCKIVDNGICTTCESYYYFDQNNKCSITQNCITSKNGLCLKCKDGYYLGLDSKCTDVEKCIYSRNNECNECEDSFYYDRMDKLCKESVDNFTNCKINDSWEPTECAACKTNFYINQMDHLCYDNTEPGPFYKCEISNNVGTFCQLCVDGYFIGQIDLNCSKIEGCSKSLDEDTCLKCDRYHCLDNLGNCTDNTYVVSEDKKYYYRCKMLNEDGTKCEVCNQKINTTDEGICYNDYPCIKDENGECIRCQKENPMGYYTYCFNKVFGCIDSFLDNCIRCDNIFDMDVCTECEEGYEIDYYGECVEIE